MTLVTAYGNKGIPIPIVGGDSPLWMLEYSSERYGNVITVSFPTFVIRFHK